MSIVLAFLVGSWWVRANVQFTDREEHVVLFSHALFLSTLFTTFVTTDGLRDRLVRAGASLAYWLFAFGAFVGEQDRLDLSEIPPGGCDGPFHGWYTFENPPMYDILLNVWFFAVIIGISGFLLLWATFKLGKFALAYLLGT